MPTTEPVATLRLPRIDWSLLALGGAVVVYFAVMLSAVVIKYWQLAMGYDLAFNEQAIWNTVHGRILEISGVDYTSTILGNDQFLFYLLLVPIYALAPSTVTLFAAATLAAALGALPIFLLSRRLLGDGLAALLVAVAFLMHPAVQNPNLYEFQVRLFAMAFLLAGIYFLELGRFWPMVAFLALAASTRSDVGLAVAGLGVYGLLTGKGARLGVAALGVGLAFFLSGVLLVVPSFNSGGSFTFARHYSSMLAGGALSVLAELLRVEKLKYLAMLFGSLGFLPLVAPVELIPALPSLGLNLLSARSIQWDLNHQYQLTILPFLFLASVRALGRLKHPYLRTAGASVLILGVLAVTYINGGSQTLAYLKHGFDPSRDYQDAVALARQIPRDAYVAASNLLAPVAMPRRGLVLLARNPLNSMDPLLRAQYIFLDTTDRASMRVIQEERVFEGGGWTTVDSRGRFMLLRRSGGSP